MCVMGKYMVLIMLLIDHQGRFIETDAFESKNNWD